MSFATSINCIDGRVQLPVSDYIRRECNVDHIDVVTIPGCDKVLADMNDDSAIDLIRRSILISISKHDSKCVYVSGHHDCAVNPVDGKKHIEQIRLAVQLIHSWNLGVRVIGLWVNENWQVEEIREVSDVS